MVLFRTVPTVNDYNRRAETVLHELAHQWFGDLVTMRWFDDLWLKEGFAQYMAYHTMADLNPPEPVWKRFYQSIKPLAYEIDSTHGTTPIYQQILNLERRQVGLWGDCLPESARSCCGCSRSISARIIFAKACGFLREHAYANAEWSDLIGAFSRASGMDLRPWAKAWVEQRGMPKIEIDWACDSERKISSFQIRQKDALGEGHLWPLRTQMLLGYADGRFERVAAALDGAQSSVPGALGKICPAFVFGNDEDHSYGLFLLDANSQTAVIAELPLVHDPFLRAVLRGALCRTACGS